MRALQRLGHEIVPFDILPFMARTRPLRSIQVRLAPRMLLASLNTALVRDATTLRRIDLVWIDKGTWIFPETLAALRRAARCPAVHYTADAQLLINRSRHFFGALRLYDLLVTTKSFEVNLYKNKGARQILVVPQSYCPERFAHPQPDSRFTCDIGLISDLKPHYTAVVRALARRRFDVGVWGTRWAHSALLGVPRTVVRGGGVWREDYVRALSSFRIGLGLLSKFIPEQHTTRTFEIPAAGTFLLAERTAEHQSFFDEGREAEFFGSIDELADKAGFYLHNDAARRAIAEAGRARCSRSGYDNDTVVSRILSELR